MKTFDIDVNDRSNSKVSPCSSELSIIEVDLSITISSMRYFPSLNAEMNESGLGSNTEVKVSRNIVLPDLIIFDALLMLLLSLFLQT